MQAFKRINLINSNLVNKNFSSSINLDKRKNLNILMLGAPGVGKGTYGRFMKSDFNLPVLSSGDELRKVLNSQKEDENQELKNILKEGKLAGDDFMLDFIKSFLKKPEFSNGIILDGYPRNEEQAKQLKNLLRVIFILKV